MSVRHLVKTAEHIVQVFSTPGSPIFLVHWK